VVCFFTFYEIQFEIKLPNDLTDKVLKDSEQGQNLHKVDSVDDLFLERTGSHSDLFK